MILMKRFGLLLTLVLLLIWFAAFRPVALGGRTSYLIIDGVSMQPTLYDGDLAVMVRQPTYAVGDVVAYPVSGGLVIHRIVVVTPQGYITQGDNRQDIDPWTPGDENVLGKMWFSIPRGGRVLVGLRQPVSLAAIAALGMLVILNEPVKTRIRRRGKRMSTETWTTPPHVGAALRSRLGAATATGDAPQDLSWLLYTCGLLVLVALLSVALGIYSYLQPSYRPVMVDRLRYAHEAAYQYQVQVEPNDLTGAGVIGPVNAAAGGTAAQSSVFTRLARTIVVDFLYRFHSTGEAAIQGELAPQLELRQDGRLLAALPLGDSLSFSTNEVVWRAEIPVSRITAWIQTLQEQAGYIAGTYTIALNPNLRLAGRLGEYTIDERVQPELTFQITESQIRFDHLEPWFEEKAVQEETAVPNEIGFGRLTLPVSDLRQLSPWLAGLSLLGALFTGYSAYWALRRDENTRIRTRYGGLIASVAEMRLPTDRMVQVSSIDDLARLSQRFNCMILHKVLSDRSHLYMIPDGEVLYLYRVPRPVDRR